MPNVLTTASIITCGHEGKVLTSSEAKLTLTIDGQTPETQRVLLKSSVLGQSISGPPNNCKTQPSSTTSPCTSVAIITLGEATKLTVQGKPVLLDTLVGTTNGNPVGTLSVEANQSKLTAI